MMRIRAAAVAVIVTGLLVGGCSSQASTEASSVAPPMDDGEPPAVETVPYGEPFEYVDMSLDGPGTTWSVALNNVDCGLNSLPKADANPNWDGSDGIPEYTSAKPPEGSEFCVLYWDWTNVGKSPGITIQSGDLMFGDERFARTVDDEMRSWTFMDTNLSVDYAAEVNPGKKTKSADIYTVDEGQTPDATWFPMETFVDEAYVLVAAK